MRLPGRSPDDDDSSEDEETHAIAVEPTQIGPRSTVKTPPGMELPAIQSDPDDPYIGTIVSERYRVIRKLGEGGMGIVYLAEHIVIEKKVALKVLSDDFARKPDLVQRFMQEAKAASRIGHENIVDITDFGQTAAGSVFIAMEFLEGMDLATAIREQGPMTFARMLPIGMQICRALSAAHGKGIIHRDMKPENIFLVTRDGRPDFVKVLDFGIAKMSTIDEPSERLTRTGMIFGTPEYMSPEQARGERPDHRVDIYALGCILYEMMTADVPFHAETFMGVLTKHMFEQPEPISARATVTPEVEAVVMRALAKNRDERFQSMRDLAQALAECSSVEEASAWGFETSGVFSAPRAAATPVATRPSLDPSLDALPKRSSGPLVIGVLVVIAVVMAAVALWPKKAPVVPVDNTQSPIVARPDVTPVPPPVVTPPVLVEHSIMVRVLPKGGPADLWSGAERLGTIPGVIKMRHSSTPLAVVARRDGSKDYAFTITPDSDREYRAELVELPRRPVVGKRPGVTKPEATHPIETHPVVAPTPVVTPPPVTKPANTTKPTPQRDGDLMNPF